MTGNKYLINHYVRKDMPLGIYLVIKLHRLALHFIRIFANILNQDENLEKEDIKWQYALFAFMYLI